MNDIQERIAALQAKGWTLAALAAELGNHLSTLEKWKAGATYPSNAAGVLLLLDRLKRRKRIPKKYRHHKPRT